VSPEHLLASPAQALEQLTNPCHSLAVAILEAPLEQPLESLAQVPVVEQVVGQLLKDLFGSYLEADLGAIPT
jgi:hypothetical protein